MGKEIDQVFKNKLTIPLLLCYILSLLCQILLFGPGMATEIKISHVQVIYSFLSSFSFSGGSLA